jgi:hypothetical protein
MNKDNEAIAELETLFAAWPKREYGVTYFFGWFDAVNDVVLPKVMASIKWKKIKCKMPSTKKWIQNCKELLKR